MKILKYLILINSILFSQSPDSLFHLANGYYVNEEFENAIIKYEQLAQIYENEDLYLNLGNSYFKIGQLGNAIWAYEKGYLLSPRDNDINYNLKFVRNQIRDRIIAPDDFFIIALYRSIINKFTLIDLIMIFGLMLLILSFLFVLHWNKKLSDKLYSILNTTLLIVLVITSGILLDKYWDVSDQEYGVVTSISLDVRSSPISRGENIVFVIHEGTKFDIINKQEGWYEISLLDGKKGWVFSNDVRSI